MTCQLKLMGQLLLKEKMENNKIIVKDESEETISYFQDFDMIDSYMGDNNTPEDKILKKNILNYVNKEPKGVRKLNILC